MNAPRKPPSAEAPEDAKNAKAEKPLGPPLVSMDSPLFKDVEVSLEARLGQTTLSVAELLELQAGAILKLNVQLGGLVELRLNQSVVARCEIVAVDDNFGVRIVEVSSF